MSSFQLQEKSFSSLSVEQLYQLLKLRFDVFVIEQNSIYNEFDEIDYRAMHLFVQDETKVLAYSRVYLKNEQTASLGRVAIHPEARGQQWGRKLVQAAIDYIRTHYEAEQILIEAQLYLKDFYQSFGFRIISGEYDDGGILHVDMVLNLDA